MVKSAGPSQYMRKALKEVYTVYGILYYDDIKQRSVAVAAAKTGDEAISMLEEALVEGKGYRFMKGQLNADAIDTGHKSSKKGLVFGFDRCSQSLLNDLP